MSNAKRRHRRRRRQQAAAHQNDKLTIDWWGPECADDMVLRGMRGPWLIDGMRDHDD